MEIKLGLTLIAFLSRITKGKRGKADATLLVRGANGHNYGPRKVAVFA